MEILETKTILKFLQITLLSYSRICYFSSAKAPKTRIKARFLQLSAQTLRIHLANLPQSVEGMVVFFSYTFIFRFKAKLRASAESGVYLCDIPAMLETFDRRKYARLKFESRENQVVTIHNKTLNSSTKGILTDISAGGIGFSVVDLDEIPKVGDLIMTNVQLKEKDFQVMVQVVQVKNDQVGGSFLEKSSKFQLELNAIVKREIEWRSEFMLQNLKRREKWVTAYHREQEKAAKTQQDFQEKLSRLDPFLDYFMDNFQVVTGIALTKKKVEYKETTAPAFLISLYLDVYFNNDTLFKGYVSTQEEVLYKMAKPIFAHKLEGRGINAAIILEELGKNLVAHSGTPGEGNQIFTVNGANIVETNKRLLSELLRHPSIQVQFDSPRGELNLTLLAENLEESLNHCFNARAREFITMEKMDLIEPISYSALKVFSEFLKLEIREKSVTRRDKLIPRFEISVMLDIFFKEIEGKVILNMSKRLALKIYETLFDEPVEEFNDEVKDAVAEITNMITGNAKSEFEKQGIYYKLATPVVVEGREGVIIFARNMNFLSSVYWTSKGFFDLSFSFFRK